MKRILSPCFRARSVTDITPAFLREQGMRAAILDLDGNLIGYQHPEASQEVVGWIANLLTEDIRLCIVSNPGPKSSLSQIASQLGLKAFKGTVPKPLPRAFIEAKRYLGVEYAEVAMVGDQLFTDILGGNLLGMTTIWTDTLGGSPEGWVTRSINRPLERLYQVRVLSKSPSISPYIDQV